MSTRFPINDPSIESQWRAIILFGKNSATYILAFAKALLEIVEKQQNRVSLSELSIPFASSIVDHLRINDKQGNSPSSNFPEGCRKYINQLISKENLYAITEK